jgi:uncharacterized protein with HEPN domain
MKNPDDLIYLRHILEAIEKIDRYVSRVDQERFREDSLIQDGVIRQVQIIGEATRRLSVQLRDYYPEIPWRDIIGMRNKLVHDYFGVDLDAVFSTAMENLPVLKPEIQRVLDHRSRAPKNDDSRAT